MAKNESLNIFIYLGLGRKIFTTLIEINIKKIFFFRLSEELYQKDDDNLNGIFRQYIERLINSLCRHCQMEPDIGN